MDVALVVLCAGDSTRFGGAVKKQWIYLKNEPLWAFCVRRLAAAAEFARVIVAGKNARYMSGFLGRVAVGGGLDGGANSNLALGLAEGLADDLAGGARMVEVEFVEGGATRTQSLKNALAGVENEFVLVSDCARVGVSQSIVRRVLGGVGAGGFGGGFGADLAQNDAEFGAAGEPNSNLGRGGGIFDGENRAENLAQNRGENVAQNLAQNLAVRVDCVVPFLSVSDTSVGGGAFIPRGSLKRIQTPQLSRTNVLKEALELGDFTDESSAISAWFFAKNSLAQGGNLAQNLSQNSPHISQNCAANFGENPAQNPGAQNPAKNPATNPAPRTTHKHQRKGGFGDKNLFETAQTLLDFGGEDESNSNLTPPPPQNPQNLAPAQTSAAQSWICCGQPLGANVRFVAGEAGAEKITFAQDLARLNLPPAAHETLVGTGFDVHEFCDGEFVTLGGVRVAHSRGLKAHSDGDAAAHALIDALLGAAGLGDVGEHFPDTDAAFAGADSLGLLRRAYALVRSVGLQLVNADITIIAQKPKISPFKAQMSRALAGVLGVPSVRVSVKATTTERLGFAGREEGLAAMASVSLRYFDWRELVGGAGDCGEG